MAARAAVLVLALVAMAEGTLPIPTWECADYTAITNPSCYEHLTWAMANGTTVNKSWYPHNTITYADFQCALYLKVGVEGAGPSHGCLLPPCTAVSANMKERDDVHRMKSVSECIAPKPTPKPEEPSFPWWGWVMIAVGVLSCVTIGVILFMQDKKKEKREPKKKRALKPAEPAPKPVETKVEPLPTYQMVYTAAPPMYHQPAPVMTIAHPVTYAAPIATMYR